jgi:SAM-dependent methyltransferase
MQKYNRTLFVRVTVSTTLHEYERERGEDEAQNDYWAQTRRGILKQWITDCNPNTLLDVGCGSGYLADYLGTGVSLVAGVDVNSTSVSLASERPNVDSAVVGDATKLPYKSETVDCMLLGDVMEHFEEPLPLLQECNRVLQSNGELIISVPAFRWLWGPHDEHNKHTDRYTKNRLSDTIFRAGFTIKQHRYVNFFPLPIYFLMQRVLKTGVPSSTRGKNSWLLEQIKNWLISIEMRVAFPLGVTLMTRCSEN